MAAALASALAACGREASTPTATPRSILLVTLDTTRADSMGPGTTGIDTPAFNALAARGRRFTRAYSTAPETLPSHASMFTGLYPAAHTVHENARTLPPDIPLATERLKQIGFRTEAIVSSFALSRRFGLARGFDAYDDADGRPERGARETTDIALARLGQAPAQPLFMWVHYFDPHFPYEPPEPYRARFAARPYLGEIAAMDEQLGRLVAAFEQRATGPVAIVVAGDHGEGLGDHGEAFHGNLLYESTARVPLVIVGPGAGPDTVDAPVSVRRVFHTLLDWAGLERAHSLRGQADGGEVVLGEAMKPFLEYGWQPQVMAVRGTTKSILSGRVENYDLAADPAESRDLGSAVTPPAELRDYPLPQAAAARRPDTLSATDRQKLASLGYVSSTATPVTRRDAPRAADMTPLFPLIDRASSLFVGGKYSEVVPLLQEILAKDPRNLDAMLRLATAHSSLGRASAAEEAFGRAAEIAPDSDDVRLYRALHLTRGKDWPRAVPLLEQVLAAIPDRVPALEALAALREREGRPQEAQALLLRLERLRPLSGSECVRLGLAAMAGGDTPVATRALESARTIQGTGFRQDLELGAVYMASGRFTDARVALDRVPASHPAYPMALFKRAQLGVLLKESDSDARIARARANADATTRELIAREKLFQRAK